MIDTVEEDRDGKVGYPLICNAHGGPSEDGRYLLVEGLTNDGQSVRFAVALGEVKHFVSFLLVSIGKITMAQRAQGVAAAQTDTPPRSIPVTSIGIGHPEAGEGYLQIAVGDADLLFALPISAFEPVARSMLLASVPGEDESPAPIN